jgi:thiol-disulfide isomerase/thioredoxin
MKQCTAAWQALAVLACVMAVQAPAAAAPSVDQPAPSLVARSFSGETFDLSALRGKVVVLNFWASWCGPCRAEMPLLEALQREYRDRGVVVAGLSADDRHDRKDALQAARAVNYFTGLLSEAQLNGFGQPQALPLTYIIGRNGLLTAVLSANRGPLSAAQLRAAIEAGLQAAEPPAAAPLGMKE